jgi:uncharacterized alkaline shock family protein YloU
MRGGEQMDEHHGGGQIRIADDVVAVIAGIAATETEGIASMSGGITEGIASRLMGKQMRKGIKVEVGTLEASIDLRVIVLYGVKIDAVCRKLQRNVKEAVESMTGLHVIEVNVYVEGVEFPEQKKQEEEVQRVK